MELLKVLVIRNVCNVLLMLIDCSMQVVEQTEFIDDASFQVFRASGKQENYTRRCANTRLSSAEKLMYICKNQLGECSGDDHSFKPPIKNFLKVLHFPSGGGVLTVQ